MIRAFRSCLVHALLLFALVSPCAAEAEGDSGSGNSGSGGLEATYQPRPPPERPVYTTDYLFAITRAVANSTIAPAGRVPLYFLTIPVDVVFFPIELIAGFFPGE